MKRSGFTLIELMVVILVVTLLAGLVFRMVALVGQSNDKAATRATLEKVGHALEEFKAQYGKYPPVPSYGSSQPLAYEFPNAASRGWGDNPEATAKKFLDGLARHRALGLRPGFAIVDDGWQRETPRTPLSYRYLAGFGTDEAKFPGGFGPVVRAASRGSRRRACPRAWPRTRSGATVRPAPRRSPTRTSTSPASSPGTTRRSCASPATGSRSCATASRSCAPRGSTA